MSKKYGLSLMLDEETENLLKMGEYLGKGHNGIVFLLPDRKIIKIFYNNKTCMREAKILKKVKGSVYFPRVIKFGNKYIIRELVEGTRMDIYLGRYGLSKEISRKIYDVIMEFKKLKFTRLDIRCKDIYVDKEENLKIIDPKNCFTREKSYPRHLMKGLKNMGVLDDFLLNISEIDRESGKKWKEGFDRYVRFNIK